MGKGKTRFAIAGFRHGHIFALVNALRERDDCEIAAWCEEDPETAAGLPEKHGIRPTHTDFARMIEETECDVVALGDYYGKRGGLARLAMEAGRHVIADKPLCTRLPEWEALARLSSTRDLKIGLMLDLRDRGQFHAARRAIADGRLGAVLAAQFTGQHPLLYGKRPDWYFDPEKHGGVFNDIAVHALDLIPFLTGLKFTGIDFARAWRGRAPHGFPDGAQCALRLENGAGVLGDVSYFAPDGCGYALPQYWRVTIWGDGGMLEACVGDGQARLADMNGSEIEALPPEPVRQTYLEAFLAELRGEAAALDTRQVLAVSRLALDLQSQADRAGTGGAE